MTRYHGKGILRSVLGAVTLAAAMQAQAALETTGSVTISQLIGYSDFGSGDVVFTASSGTSTCSGFWLRPTDAGFKTLYGMLIVAYATQAPLTISAYNDSIWSGSSSNFCRIYNLAPMR